MSITVRELIRARRNYLQDLRWLMSQVDREQETLERVIKRILQNSRRVPEPKDYENMARRYIEIIKQIDIFAKLLKSGYPNQNYVRQYGTVPKKRRRTA